MDYELEYTDEGSCRVEPTDNPFIPKLLTMSSVLKCYSCARYGQNKLVGVRGFEPPTFHSRSECATRLRYTPTDNMLNITIPLGNLFILESSFY
jgi:hypothetical protein